MSRKSSSSDYESVVRSRPIAWWEDERVVAAEWPTGSARTAESEAVLAPLAPAPSAPPITDAPPRVERQPSWILRRGHAVSYLGLFLFTLVVYFRPYEMFPALSSFKTMAYWLAVATCAAFIPSQLSIEGTLTARPREVNLVLLLSLAALVSIPLAIEPATAWAKFVDFAKVIFMFIVMVNVVRTERRLKWLILLALVVSLVLSVGAINDYRLGRFALRGLRIQGIIRNLFDNPNDLALHLVTMIPIAVGLLFASRAYFKKILYGAAALTMLLATIFTFSRGGFLALMVAAFVIVWKLGRRNRTSVVAGALLFAALFIVLTPGNYAGRMASIFDNDLDESGSATSRQNLLLRSLLVTARHPLLGIGMNNFPLVSIHDQVSHNAYTQVSAELGVPAMIVYILFIVAPLKRMKEIENETFEQRRSSRVYYLAVGLQASLLSYMVSSFFASVAYQWNIYYLVGYALCLHRLYQAGSLAPPLSPAGRQAQPTTRDAKIYGRAAAFNKLPARDAAQRTVIGE